MFGLTSLAHTINQSGFPMQGCCPCCPLEREHVSRVTTSVRVFAAHPPNCDFTVLRYTETVLLGLHNMRISMLVEMGSLLAGTSGSTHCLWIFCWQFLWTFGIQNVLHSQSSHRSPLSCVGKL